MKKDYIIVIDSGIGGLSTLSTCIKHNNYNYIYIADNKNIPYGSHSENEIQSYLIEIILKLKKLYDFKIVILACNTATTTSIEQLRNLFKDIIFIGTEPAIKLAYKQSFKNILCITTPATSKQKKFLELKNSLNCNIKILTIDNLAQNIEEYIVKKTYFSYAKVLKHCFNILKQAKNYDCLVLGCTHYIFLDSILKKYSNIKLLNGNNGVQKQLSKTINKISINKTNKTNIKFYNTLGLKHVNQNNKKILGQILANDENL